ncbi:MAG: hypothetical protein KDD58_15410 [Bdellovibrionales bacterium]|nr:hypothetical protein [Bdellovibrionales bacterium]
MQTNRNAEDVLRGLLGSGFSGTQKDLQKTLSKNGVFVTQSTISRILKKLGASRNRSENKTIYMVDKKTNSVQIPISNFQKLIVSIKSNENTIVVKTIPGSAMFVAGFIDHKCAGFILGTVAGDDTIFVAPNSVQNMTLARENIEKELTG